MERIEQASWLPSTPAVIAASDPQLMKTVQRVALFCLLSMRCASPAPGQSVGPIADPCGDPVVESFSCPLLRGKVVKVCDGDTLTLELANRRRLRVHLVGIAAPELQQQFGRVSRRLLRSLVSGRVVEVCVNASQYLLLLRSKVKGVTGVVHVREMGMLDVNLMMIQDGLARHSDAKPHSMSNHAECHYVRAEEEARAARRDLWSTRHNNGLHPAADTTIVVLLQRLGAAGDARR